MGYNVLDTETTGLDPVKDQIIEYYGAYAVRTTPLPNSDLAIADRQGPLRCRLMRNILPSPQALRVNNLRLADINKAPLSHYQMMRTIIDKQDNYSRDERLFTTAYNLPFDERRLRIDAFRNILSPGFMRDISQRRVAFDTLKMVRAASRLYPDQFVIPEENNKPIFRQGLFARANGLHFPAEYEHSAEHDVEDGTFAIASHVRQLLPNVWDLAVQTADTPFLISRIRQNPNQIFIHVNTTSNRRDIMLCSLLTLRQPDLTSTRVSPHAMVWDLTHDPSIFNTATPEERLQWVEGAYKKYDRDDSTAPHGIWPIKIINLRDDHVFTSLQRVKDSPTVKELIKSSPGLKERHETAQGLDRAALQPLYDRLSAMFVFEPSPIGSPIEQFVFNKDDGVELTTELSDFVNRSNRTKLKQLIARFHSCDDWDVRGREILPEVKKLSALVWERMLYLVGEHSFESLDYFSGDAAHYVEKLKRDLEGPNSPYRTYTEVIAETEQLIQSGNKADRAFYGDMLDELRRMRSRDQNFFATWEDQHRPATASVDIYSGTVTPEAGKILTVTLG
jgi:exonuclease I